METLQLPMVIDQPKVPAIWKKRRKTWKIKEFVQMYREPVVTYCITPNNAPENSDNYDTGFSRGNRRSNKRVTDFENDIFQDSSSSATLKYH